MRTINVSISDFEYNQLGLNTDKIQFTEFVDIIDREIAKQTLSQSVRLAEKYNLSDMSLDDINQEVKAVKNAEDNT